MLRALTLGATFVARSFSGDKAQLVPILKAGLSHGGFALIDVISPCVTFNDHEGSTKSYLHTRKHQMELAPVDFVPLRREITAESGMPGGVTSVTMHDGSTVRFRKPHAGYSPTDRLAAYSHVKECVARGEIATGLLYLNDRGLARQRTSVGVERRAYTCRWVRSPRLDWRWCDARRGVSIRRS